MAGHTFHLEGRVCDVEGTSKQIAEAVRSTVEASGMSQAELAKLLHRSISTVERRLAGKRDFTVNEIVVIARHLGRSVSSVVGDDVLIGPGER